MRLSLDVSVLMGELGAHPQVNYIQEGYNGLDGWILHTGCVSPLSVYFCTMV